MKSLEPILKYSIIGGIFMLLITPFLVMPSLFFPFITGKAFFFRIVIEIVFGLWLILALINPQYRPAKSYILYAYTAFLVALIVATIFAVNPVKSFWSNFERMEGLITHLHLFAYFIVLISVFKTREIWDWFLNSSLVVSLGIAVYGFQQLRGKLDIHQGSERLDATLGNSDYLAVYMLFNVFIALYLLVRSLGRRKEDAWLYAVLYGAVVIIDFIILFNTGTRMAVGGLYLGLLATSVLLVWAMRGVWRKASIALLAVLIVAPIGFVAIRNTSLIQQNVTLRRLAQTVDNWEGAIESRRYLWPMSFGGFKERPIFGWGPDNYNVVFNQNYDPNMWKQEKWFDRSHNVFLDWLITAGIVGLLTYLSIFAAAIYYLWRLYRGKHVPDRSTSNESGYYAVVIGLLVAYFTQNLTVFDNLVSYIYFFAILAWLHTLNSGSVSPRWAKPITREWQYAGGVIALCLIVGSIYFFNAKPIAAAAGLVQAITPPNSTESANMPGYVAAKLAKFKEILPLTDFAKPEIREQFIQTAATVSSFSVPDDLKREFIGMAFDEMAKQVTETPADARYPYFLGLYLSNFGRPADALSYLKTALTLSPRKQEIYFAIVSANIQQRQFIEALQAAKTAYEFDPDYDTARNVYAAAAIYAGDNKLAESILLPRYNTMLVNDDLILNAYVTTKQYDKVSAIWQERITKNPNDPQQRLSLAAAYLAMGKRNMAIAEIQKAIELAPAFRAQGLNYIRAIQEGRNP